MRRDNKTDEMIRDGENRKEVMDKKRKEKRGGIKRKRRKEI